MISPPFSVLVADDHPLYREGVIRAVRQRSDLELVGEAADGRRALAELQERRPDVALLDVQMPGLDGLRVLRAARREGLDTRIVLLAANVESRLVYEAIAGGAAGFIGKEASREEICMTLVEAAAGRPHLAPSIQSCLIEQIQVRALDGGPRLSERESTVLGYIADGLLAPEIAERMVLSPATVKSHMQTLYDKLGVSDRAAAVAVAMRAGLME